MVIDNSAGSEVRPLVLKSVVENGESVVTLAESTDLDLKTLYVNNYSHVINVQGLNVAYPEIYQISISETDANLLALAILNPTEQILIKPGQQGGLGDYVTFDSGLVKTYRRYFSIQNIPSLEYNENGDIINTFGSLDVVTCNTPSFISNQENEYNSFNILNDPANIETVVEDGVTKIVSVSCKDWNGLALKISAANLADIKVDDVICVEFVLRNEGELSAAKITGLALPEQGQDAVNLDYMNAQVAALEATDQAQMAYINQRVAELTDRIQNQDAFEAYSPARWTNAKAALYSDEGSKTRFLAHFNDMSVNSLKDSTGNSEIEPGIILSRELGSTGSVSIIDVNKNLQSGFYKIFASENAQSGGFPAASYNHQSNVMADVYSTGNLLDVRYYANQEALDNNVYTVVATNIQLQSKIIVDPVMFPNWTIGNTYDGSSTLPSFVTVEEGDRLSAGHINTIPGFFSWYARTNRNVGDDSPGSGYVVEFVPGAEALQFQVANNVEISSTESRLGGKSLKINDEVSRVVVSNKKGLFDANKDFCIEGWFKFNQIEPNGQQVQTLFAISDVTGTVPFAGVILMINPDGSANVYANIGVQNGGVYDTNLGAVESLFNGSWKHVAFVKKQNEIQVYFNGIAVGDGFTISDENKMSEFIKYHNLYIGGKGAAGNLSLNGFVDEVRVTVGDSVYNANFTPPTGQFTALPFIVFPDMSKLSPLSSAIGVTLPNPPVNESTMTQDQIDASHIRKVYTAGVARNVATWQTPSGEVYIGTNGDLVETKPTSGRIIKLGQKINETDLMLDVQDYGFISGVTTRRKRFNFGDLEPVTPRPLNTKIISFNERNHIDNADGTFTVNFKVSFSDATSAKIFRLSDESLILSFDSTQSGVNGLFGISVPQNSSESFRLVLDDSSDLTDMDKVAEISVSTGTSLYSNADLQLLKVNGESTTLLNVPFGTSSVYVEAVPVNPSPSTLVSVRNVTLGVTFDPGVDGLVPVEGLVVGDNIIEVTVVAADGITTRIYEITVVVAAPSTNTNLSTFTINGTNVADGDTFNVPYGTTSVEVSALPEDPNATYSVTGMIDLTTGNNDVVVTVLSEGGAASRDHTVTVVVAAPSTNTNLSTFTINGSNVIDGDTVNVPYGTTSVEVIAQPEDPNATYSYSGHVNLNTGNNTVVVTVVSEGGAASRNYTITVVVASS